MIVLSGGRNDTGRPWIGLATSRLHDERMLAEWRRWIALMLLAELQVNLGLDLIEIDTQNVVGLFDTTNHGMFLRSSRSTFFAKTKMFGRMYMPPHICREIFNFLAI